MGVCKCREQDEEAGLDLQGGGMLEAPALPLQALNLRKP